MLRSVPIRLMALVLVVSALAFATIRVTGVLKSHASSPMEQKLALGEITIPVEVIETGEAPATLEVRVRP